MTCNYDRELLALFAGGDLSPAEGELVEAHLGACPECGAIVAQYRAGAELLAAVAPVVPEVLRRRRAARPVWMTAAAAVLVILLGVVLTQGSVVAAVLRWFQVREATPEEIQQIVERSAERSYVLPMTDSTTPAGAPELEKRYGLPIARPDLGPEWEWISVTTPRGDKPEYIQLHYHRQGGGDLYIMQRRSEVKATLLVPPGMSKQVTVNGQEAWMAWGGFTRVTEFNPSGYDDGIDSRLYFDWRGQFTEVAYHNSRLTREQLQAELMQIAESLK